MSEPCGCSDEYKCPIHDEDANTAAYGPELLGLKYASRFSESAVSILTPSTTATDVPESYVRELLQRRGMKRVSEIFARSERPEPRGSPSIDSVPSLDPWSDTIDDFPSQETLEHASIEIYSDRPKHELSSQNVPKHPTHSTPLSRMDSQPYQGMSRFSPNYKVSHDVEYAENRMMQTPRRPGNSYDYGINQMTPVTAFKGTRPHSQAIAQYQYQSQPSQPIYQERPYDQEQYYQQPSASQYSQNYCPPQYDHADYGYSQQAQHYDDQAPPNPQYSTGGQYSQSYGNPHGLAQYAEQQYSQPNDTQYYDQPRETYQSGYEQPYDHQQEYEEGYGNDGYYDEVCYYPDAGYQGYNGSQEIGDDYLSEQSEDDIPVVPLPAEIFETDEQDDDAPIENIEEEFDSSSEYSLTDSQSRERSSVRDSIGSFIDFAPEYNNGKFIRDKGDELDEPLERYDGMRARGFFTKYTKKQCGSKLRPGHFAFAQQRAPMHQSYGPTAARHALTQQPYLTPAYPRTSRPPPKELPYAVPMDMATPTKPRHMTEYYRSPHPYH